MTSEGRSGRRATETRTDYGRVLLIDSDRELADMLGQLLRENGLAVDHLACAADAGYCAREAATRRPDLVLVDVAHPYGWDTDLHGWTCLQQLQAKTRAQRLHVLGYSVFDRHSLLELGLDLHASAVPVVTNVTDPGRFADAIARSLTPPRVA